MRTHKIIVPCMVVTMTLFTQSCISISNWGLKKDRQEIAGEITRKEGELDRHTRAFVSGAVDALSLSEEKSKEDLLLSQAATTAATSS